MRIGTSTFSKWVRERVDVGVDACTGVCPTVLLAFEVRGMHGTRTGACIARVLVNSGGTGKRRSIATVPWPAKTWHASSQGRGSGCRSCCRATVMVACRRGEASTREGLLLLLMLEHGDGWRGNVATPTADAAGAYACARPRGTVVPAALRLHLVVVTRALL